MKNLNAWKKSIPVLSSHLQNPFVSLQKEVDNAINQFYNLFEIPSSYSSTDIEKLMINPSVDIVEDENTFKVEIEVPGMGQEDIKATIKNNVLSIRGNKETSKKDEGKNYISREIEYGVYERNILLPDYVDADKATASFKKGMLWVTIPKKEGEKKQPSREIKIERVDEK